MSESAGPQGAPRRSGSELALRVASAVVLASAALLVAWTGGPLFALFWTVAAILLLREWLGIVGVREWRLQAAWLCGSIAIAAAAVFAEAMAGALAPTVGLILLGAVAAFAIAASGTRLLAAAGVLYASVVAVVPVEVRGNPAFGLVAVLWMFAVVWGTDIVAYFAGRGIGGPKLWPRVSPKKTWSGFIGGVLGGSAAAVFVVQVARHRYGLGWYSETALVTLSVIAAILSQGGDLLESSIKRHFGVKDASHIIPGHGGVMDRLDSFWAVCVVLAVLMYATSGPG